MDVQKPRPSNEDGVFSLRLDRNQNKDEPRLDVPSYDYVKTAKDDCLFYLNQKMRKNDP